MLEWIKDHPTIGWVTIGISVAMLVASMVIVPAIVVRIEPDYFSHAKRPTTARPGHSSRTVRILYRVGKNVLGVILILAGLVMFVLPGQGLLTLVLGLLFVDLPGKYRIERWLFSRRPVTRSVNWLRRRAGRKPIIV